MNTEDTESTESTESTDTVILSMNRKLHFTLIELLAAVAIVIILAGILVGGIGYAGRRADEAKSYAILESLAMALEQFKVDNGYYPMSSKDGTKGKDAVVKFYRNSADSTLMMVLSDGDKNHEYRFYNPASKKAYFDISDLPASASSKSSAVSLSDAWGGDDGVFHYRCPGSHNRAAYDLWSPGRDGKSGNEDERLDDITNWEKE